MIAYDWLLSRTKKYLDQRINLFLDSDDPTDEPAQQHWKQNRRKPPNENNSDVDSHQTAGGKLGKLFSIIEPRQNHSGNCRAEQLSVLYHA